MSAILARTIMGVHAQLDQKRKRKLRSLASSVRRGAQAQDNILSVIRTSCWHSSTIQIIWSSCSNRIRCYSKTKCNPLPNMSDRMAAMWDRLRCKTHQKAQYIMNNLRTWTISTMMFSLQAGKISNRMSWGVKMEWKYRYRVNTDDTDKYGSNNLKHLFICKIK